MTRATPWLVTIILALAAPAAAQAPPAVATDRLGFTQPAAATEPIGSFTWAIVIDGARQPLPGVTCQPAPAPAAFDCVAPFPAMTPGLHTLELIAIRTEGTLVLESPKSAPFPVRFVVAPAAPAALRIVRP